jgi:putative transposase
MPRGRRVKSPDSIYHVMVRCIQEVKMFNKDSDKEFYMYLIRKYQKQYKFKVYGYCLMSNHGHLIIDANGADISTIMHGINFTFARNYNKNNNRRGTLFQDRFKSKVIEDDRYIITLSAYIHNNPKDIDEYHEDPANYNYSSLSAYLGYKKDEHQILDESFIMQMFGKRKSEARKNYARLMSICDEALLKDEIEFKDDKTEYKSGRKILVRDLDPKEIIEYVSSITGTNSEKVHLKNSRLTTEAKALSVLLMKNLCNYKCHEIGEVLGNITIGRVSKLCSIGLGMIDEKEDYKYLIRHFISKHKIS